MNDQIRYAQQEILRAGNWLVSANMRLEGTKYESDMRKIMDSLSNLNSKLINDIKKK